MAEIRLKDAMSIAMFVREQAPPNFDLILKVFPNANRRGVLFAYGDTIYNPSGIEIPLPLARHECTHSLQQAGAPDKWWDRYLTDKEFRFAQELEAHRVEVEQVAQDYGRTVRRRYTASAAERLSGDLYGGMCSKREAIALLKEYARG